MKESRGSQITRQYLFYFHKHIDDVIQGRTMEFIELYAYCRKVLITAANSSCS